MSPQDHLKKFTKSLIENNSLLNRSLLNPRIGHHGSDPWSFDFDIAAQPIILSFKFKENEIECCINLRVRKNQTEFAARIRQVYGNQVEKIGVDIRNKGLQAYFKPFGTQHGTNTRDIYFPAGSSIDMSQAVEVYKCHIIPHGGSISLRDAVILVLKQLETFHEVPVASLEPSDSEAPPAERVVEAPSTPPPTVTMQAAVQPVHAVMPLVNQIMHFLHDHCTGGKAENQQRFVTELKGILEQTTLKKRTPDELWQLMWDKPIYANQNNNVATKVIQRCRQNKIFDNFEKIPHDQPGKFKLLDGLRAPDEKLERIRRLSQVVIDIHSLYEATLQTLNDLDASHLQNSMDDDFDTVRAIIGVPPASSNRPSIYQVAHKLKGFGGITELHMLMDFGFPVCKPDLWLVRAVTALLQLRNSSIPGLFEFISNKHPNFNPDEINKIKKKPWYSLSALDYLVRSELDFDDPFFYTHGIDAKLRFRGHRLADLMIAKFGMQPEQRFGLVRSPKDQLNMDFRLQETWPDLAKLAAVLRQ